MPRVLGWLTLLAFTVGSAHTTHAEPTTVQVRVLSYNIHHGAGTDGELDLPRIANVIKRLKPDLVALQEVDKKTQRSRGVDQAAELGRLTGMHAVFGKAMEYAGGEYGEAILSRLPLQQVTVHALPAPEKCEPRCALAAVVQFDGIGSKVLFVGTHLEHADTTVRLCQAGKLSPLLAKDNRLPTILAGDFNAVPGSPPINVLLAHWSYATADDPQPTWPSKDPQVKLDYVFFRPAASWRVVDVQVVDELVASDHRPLLVVLEWRADE
jgi:endonuclease/exonuclease/phosphatase family metal-dependent hydrolase